MRSHHGAGRLAVEVEIARMELVPGALQFLPGGRIDGPGEPELSIIGDIEGIISIAGLDDGQHRPKNLLLRNTGGWGYICNDGRLDEITVTGIFCRASTKDQPAFLLPDLYIFQNLLILFFTDY